MYIDRWLWYNKNTAQSEESDFSNMNNYMAPLEGITGYIYRNAYSTYFPKFDKYVTPFLSPHGEKESLMQKERRDVAPENNQGLYVVPQILTNKSADFIWLAKYLQGLGYEEVNLNLGCPSGTVFSKGKGAGFLARPKELQQFLTEIFEAVDMRISIKTRIGVSDVTEFSELLEIFNQFPLEELIIHPRLRQEFYNGMPHREVYEEAERGTKHKLCYNGDLFLQEHVEGFLEATKTKSLMLGRGILRNPGLLELIQTGSMPEKALIKEFHDRLYADYKALMPGDKPTLYKMKELWFYMGSLFTGWEEGHAKEIRKVNRLADYEQVVKRIFRDEQYVNI